MSDPAGFDPSAFGASFQGFLKQMATSGPANEAPFVRLLREHFGADPTSLPIVAEAFKPHDQPNLQRALDGWLADEGRSSEVRGVAGAHQRFMSLGLSDLLTPSSPLGGELGEGPVAYVNVTLHDDTVLTCVQMGLFLIRDGEERLAVLVRGPSEVGIDRELRTEVMAPTRDAACRLLADLRAAIRASNVYRGRIVSLEAKQGRGFGARLSVSFHRLPDVQRAGIVLPQGLLERIERHTVRFARHSETLRRAGRHLKRGLLLHGPPGTGKTLTAMYLASQMPDRTVLLLTGQGLDLLQESCAMARLLQPATLILEDVDLIAGERSGSGKAPLLFELLNQMDGLSEDADVLFLLTTNRPEVLEPALATRPGRIDVALEVPLPDPTCRERLFRLYAEGLELAVDDLGPYVRRTDGVSAAFIRELLRKAALLAAEEADPAGAEADLTVAAHHLDGALDEMLEGGRLSRSLLGFHVPEPE